MNKWITTAAVCLGLQVLIVSSGMAEVKKSAQRFPYVTELRGSADMIDKNGVSTPAKKMASMIERVTYVVPAGSELEVQIGADSVLRIFADSKVELPVLSWETGDAEKIILHKGRLRYHCEGDCSRTVQSPLSQDLVKEGDFEYSYDGKIPKIHVKVHKGTLSFRGLENEETVELAEGKMTSFIGELEGGAPTYDVLLKGRKVARGKLAEVQSFEPEIVKPLAEVRKAEVIKEKKVAAVKAAQPKSLCQKPNGNLNQCAWMCEHFKLKDTGCNVNKGAECVRYRCNANGEWADRQVLSAGQNRCTRSAQVAECDY